MSHTFPRHTKSSLPVAVGGEGCYLIDSTGKRYLDGSSGAAVSCLGHGNKTVIDAIKAQLDQVAFAHTGFFTSEPAEALAEHLIERAPEGLSRSYFPKAKLPRQYLGSAGSGWECVAARTLCAVNDRDLSHFALLRISGPLGG